MKTGIVVAGVVVFIIGIAIFGAFEFTPAPTTMTTTTANESVVPNANRNIDGGGTWSFGFNGLKGETVTGTATVSNYNAAGGPIFFYIMNESSFIYWGGASPAVVPGAVAAGNLVNYSIPSSGTKTFSFTVPTTGGWYMVFDNEFNSASAQASITSSGVAMVESSTSSPYLGGSLPAIGAVIAVLGIVIGGFGFVAAGSKPREPPVPAPAPAQGT